ncbi:kinesin, putative [Bodo saltans]|uniref:Kinesin, putative n=1 Tax=Bodo saltans TaxID=75058 RepID=A0A0S4IM71_BODSA|nr:kinesin, putative [Bodo saltans]|eukprot:CUF39380.1 kinesin, putative [Bodo saltans]
MSSSTATASRRPLQVVVRLRVDDPDPKSPHDLPCISNDLPTGGVVLRDTSIPSGGIQRSFHVDTFLPSNLSNVDVFNQVCQPTMDRAIEAGVTDTLCFLAYGHTNSGKTHTIAGNGAEGGATSKTGTKEDGLLTLTAMYLLSQFGAIDVTMIEVYGEQVYDMLAKGQQRRVRRIASAQKGGAPVLVVEGLSTRRIFREDEWRAAADCGWSFRKTSPMDLNSRSSRSHAIFTLKVPSGLSICLVDLAGSERQSIFTKQLNKESIAINKSLSRLSTVIQSLGSSSTRRSASTGGGGYVNFRDTTLTVLLQRYLTGSSLTTFIACVHPNVFFYAESLSTLRYTSRLHHITTEGPSASLPSSSLSRRGSRHGSVDSAWSNDHADRLLTEVMALRQELTASSKLSLAREQEFQEKILMVEMERQRLLELQQHHRPHYDPQSSLVEVNLSALSVHSGSSATGGGAGGGAIGGRGSRDTKRVASWLLSAVASSLPQFTVMFDDYFHDALPRDITCIGYVTCMACLLPRDAEDTTTRLGILDAGDLVMALTMLDAGIPPFVNLHEPGCRETNCWEAFDLGDGVRAYALSMFDVHVEQVDSLCIQPEDEDFNNNNNSSSRSTSFNSHTYHRSSSQQTFRSNMSPPPSSSCCDVFSSYDSLVPFAVVFAVDAAAPLHHHEALYHHLATLQMHQDAIQQDVQDWKRIPRGGEKVDDEEQQHDNMLGGAVEQIDIGDHEHHHDASRDDNLQFVASDEQHDCDEISCPPHFDDSVAFVTPGRHNNVPPSQEEEAVHSTTHRAQGDVNEPLSSWGHGVPPPLSSRGRANLQRALGNSPFSEFHRRHQQQLDDDSDDSDDDDETLNRRKSTTSAGGSLDAEEHSLSLLDVVLGQIYEQAHHLKGSAAETTQSHHRRNTMTTIEVSPHQSHLVKNNSNHLPPRSPCHNHAVQQSNVVLPSHNMNTVNTSAASSSAQITSRQIIPHHSSRLGFVSESPRRSSSSSLACNEGSSPSSPQWNVEEERGEEEPLTGTQASASAVVEMNLSDHQSSGRLRRSMNDSTATEDRQMSEDALLPIFSFSPSPSAQRESSAVATDTADAQSTTQRQPTLSVGPSQDSASRSSTPIDSPVKPTTLMQALTFTTMSSVLHQQTNEHDQEEQLNNGGMTTPEAQDSRKASLVMELTPVGPQRSHALWKAKKKHGSSSFSSSSGTPSRPAQSGVLGVIDDNVMTRKSKKVKGDTEDTPICQACSLM